MRKTLGKLARARWGTAWAEAGGVGPSCLRPAHRTPSVPGQT